MSMNGLLTFYKFIIVLVIIVAILILGIVIINDGDNSVAVKDRSHKIVIELSKDEYCK